MLRMEACPKELYIGMNAVVEQVSEPA
jgi:hypothetical protein